MCQVLRESLWIQSLLSQKSLSRSHPEAGYLAGIVLSLFSGFAFGFLGGPPLSSTLLVYHWA